MTLDEIRAIAAELLRASAEVRREMAAATQRMELRQNREMPSWPRYEKAREEWDALPPKLASEA